MSTPADHPSTKHWGIRFRPPELLSDREGLGQGAAGAASSLFQVAAVAGAFVVSGCGPRPAACGRVSSWSPCRSSRCRWGCSSPPAGGRCGARWGGVAQGGLLTVVFSAVIARARDSVDNRRIAALVQGGRYVLGALGPTVFGAVHEGTDGWAGPLLVVTGALVLLAVAGFLAVGGIRSELRPAGHRAEAATGGVQKGGSSAKTGVGVGPI